MCQRIALNKFTGTNKLSFKEINEQIAELLKQSVQSEGVINLFEDNNEDFSIFSPKYLEEIARMKEKNLAAELLRKLIDEQVRLYQKTDFVKARQFSQRMQSLMNFIDMIKDIKQELEAPCAYAKFSFPYYIEKSAPISREVSLMEYLCQFEGSSSDDHDSLFLSVKVPVTTLCPCSKAISEMSSEQWKVLV